MKTHEITIQKKLMDLENSWHISCFEYFDDKKQTIINKHTFYCNVCNKVSECLLKHKVDPLFECPSGCKSTIVRQRFEYREECSDVLEDCSDICQDVFENEHLNYSYETKVTDASWIVEASLYFPQRNQDNSFPFEKRFVMGLEIYTSLSLIKIDNQYCDIFNNTPIIREIKLSDFSFMGNLDFYSHRASIVRLLNQTLPNLIIKAVNDPSNRPKRWSVDEIDFPYTNWIPERSIRLKELLLSLRYPKVMPRIVHTMKHYESMVKMYSLFETIDQIYQHILNTNDAELLHLHRKKLKYLQDKSIEYDLRGDYIFSRALTDRNQIKRIIAHETAIDSFYQDNFFDDIEFIKMLMQGHNEKDLVDFFSSNHCTILWRHH